MYTNQGTGDDLGIIIRQALSDVAKSPDMEMRLLTDVTNVSREGHELSSVTPRLLTLDYIEILLPAKSTSVCSLLEVELCLPLKMMASDLSRFSDNTLVENKVQSSDIFVN